MSLGSENKPFTKDMKLKSKNTLDRFPPFLKTEQMNMLMIRHDVSANPNMESETLITVMKDIRYHKIHEKACAPIT